MALDLRPQQSITSFFFSQAICYQIEGEVGAGGIAMTFEVACFIILAVAKPRQMKS